MNEADWIIQGQEAWEWLIQTRWTRLLLLFLLLRTGLRLFKWITNKRVMKYIDEKREVTLKKMSYSLAAYGLSIAYLLYAISLYVPDFGKVLAGAGIAGAALAFGAQSLVKDMLAGIFFLYEKQLRAGDVVRVNNTYTGTVEEPGLRITKIRLFNGDLLIMPNGSINDVINSHAWKSRINEKIVVSTSEDPRRIREMLEQACVMLNEKYAHYLLLDEHGEPLEAYQAKAVTDFNKLGTGHEYTVFATISPDVMFDARCDIRFEIACLFKEHDVRLAEQIVRYTARMTAK